MWHAIEASSHHTSFGRTSGITNIRMPPLQICGHCRARPKSNVVLSTRPTASRYDPINRSIEEERRVRVPDIAVMVIALGRHSSSVSGCWPLGKLHSGEGNGKEVKGKKAAS